ncbi:MAG: hypothetical protein WC750_03320 [Patescibacteria group bacterium]|jgi:hypothetical protein
MNSIKMIAFVLVVLSAFGCQNEKTMRPALSNEPGVMCPSPTLVNVTLVLCKNPQIAQSCAKSCAAVAPKSEIEIQNTSPFIMTVCDDHDGNGGCHVTSYLAPGETRSVAINSSIPEFKFYTQN